MGAVARGSRAIDRARAELAERLRARRAEIEGAIATRVYAISDPREVGDPAYLEGLRTALAASLDYVFAAIELGERRAPDVPLSLLAQARMAARNRIGLNIVLRRYFAGYSLLTELAIEEAEEGDLLQDAALRQVLRGQAALFDRLVGAVSEEHARETSSRPTTSAARRRQCVQRLLAGEPVDDVELGYDLDTHHLALMARGEGGEEAMRELAARLDRRLLVVRLDEQPLWACWLGGRQPLAPERALQALRDISSGHLVVAIGEPAEGRSGWRLSHRQARATLSVTRRGGEPLVRYANVALLASLLQDDLLATSLWSIYLTPLESDRDGGAAARDTLRAYFAAGRNAASAAATLDISRQAVAGRLQSIESTLGRRLCDCAAEVEMALQLHDLTDLDRDKQTDEPRYLSQARALRR